MNNLLVAFGSAVLVGTAGHCLAADKTASDDASAVVNSTSSVAYSDELPWELVLNHWSQEKNIPLGIITDGGRLGSGTRRFSAESVRKAYGMAGSRHGAHHHIVTPKQLLNAIVAENSDYEWKSVRGVINILPKNMGKKYLLPLNRPIATFKAHSYSFVEALRLLFKQEKLPVQVSSSVSGSINTFRATTPTDYICENVTILECINIIAKQNHSFWQLTYRQDRKTFFMNSDAGVQY